MKKALLAIFLFFSLNLYGAGAKIDIPKNMIGLGKDFSEHMIVPQLKEV